MVHQEFKLISDCEVILIPEGEKVILNKGKIVTVTQTLGGTITIKDDAGVYRLDAKSIDALGSDAKEALDIVVPYEFTGEFSEEMVWEALRNCYDPEIPINIVDLGLVYDVEVIQEGNSEDLEKQYQVNVKMTLTTRGCGMGPSITQDAKSKIESIPQVKSAVIDILWDPAWTPHMISEAGRQILGFV